MNTRCVVATTLVEAHQKKTIPMKHIFNKVMDIVSSQIADVNNSLGLDFAMNTET